MASRYVPIDRIEFESLMRGSMGFQPVQEKGVHELIYERQVETRTGVTFPYKVRVYSSLSTASGISRDCGEDAIRIVLFDMKNDRPIMKGPRVYRTKSALPNMKERCRELFAYVIDSANHCPHCGSLLVERKGKFGPFKGCSDYPNCTYANRS